MKKYNKIVSFFIAFVLIICLTACGSKTEGGSNSGIFSKSLSASDLNIDDFVWKTEKINNNYGSTVYALSLTNNSKYDLIGVDFTYKVKDDVTDSQLDIYSDFMKDHDGYIDEDDSPKNVNLRTSKNIMVLKGETVSELSFAIGYENYYWYDHPTDEQFNLMEPKELQIGVVNDGVLYVAYYDFVTKTWKIDDKKVEIDKWPETELSKLVVKPNSPHIVVNENSSDRFKFYAYNFDEDSFKEYYEKIKESGFVDDDPSRINYDAEKDGYEIDVWLDDFEKNISVTVKKK